MRHLILAVVVLGCASIALPAYVLAAQCGTERWEVKVGRDNDVSKVDTTPVKSTVAELVKVKFPKNPNSKAQSRFAAELKVFEVSATITVIKLERTDSDYHLVLKDASGKTMIAESPDPECARQSRFAKEIGEVRAALDKQFNGPVKRKKKPNVKAIIRGVAFFDKLHGQEGVARNGIELHPILDVQFE